MNVRAFNIVPEVSEIVLISFCSSFFFSDSFISTILSSISLILSSASFILLFVVLVFWWVELYFFSLECNEVFSS